MIKQAVAALGAATAVFSGLACTCENLSANTRW